MYLKDKLEDDELDLSMTQLTEIPVKVTPDTYFLS